VDEDTEEKITYQIVGVDEADIKKGLLSIISPLARALIGKSVGETCDINTPGKGHKSYEILEVAYR
jgi:transcription elongation factor GreA